MDYNMLLDELRSERDQVTQAIGDLENLARVLAMIVCRHYKFMAHGMGDNNSEAGLRTAVPKKRGFSAEARMRMAGAQRKRWAESRQSAAAKAN